MDSVVKCSYGECSWLGGSILNFNGPWLNVYLEKSGKLLKWGEKRGGAAGRSSFWPREIDRSHHLNQDQYHQEQINFLLNSAIIYAM